MDWIGSDILSLSLSLPFARSELHGWMGRIGGEGRWDRIGLGGEWSGGIDGEREICENGSCELDWLVD